MKLVHMLVLQLASFGLLITVHPIRRARSNAFAIVSTTITFIAMSINQAVVSSLNLFYLSWGNRAEVRVQGTRIQAGGFRWKIICLELHSKLNDVIRLDFVSFIHNLLDVTGIDRRVGNDPLVDKGSYQKDMVGHDRTHKENQVRKVEEGEKGKGRK
ncbi:hypothetical protein F5J12DRAFT_930012 [Pisolithus orientalis]|uniref:uncharacterized protein n=1 Tax=Pisolithus orientalis TaxID=936130 RepID=UPI0022248CEB|nr:uncharacterized protein F5J12DRAFT_930012 [Pisolithus orientalis]KAI5989216.1 hypothetical protein F5J12DRAFT_930012 [Pisolithus orientalis]